MNVDVAANKRFLDTSATRSAQNWDELLVSQVDLSIGSELTMLLSLEQWHRARRVIDAGCGNGYYLAQLREHFADKNYLGIDISPELTASALTRHPEIEFETADFFAASAAPADVVVMRFLVQHLGDFAAILRQARQMLRPGGVLIIIEADLSRSVIRPLPPMFLQMLATYQKASVADGGLKDQLLDDVGALIAKSGESWQVAATRENGTSLVGPFAGGNLIKVFGIWVELAESSAMFEFDFAAVRRELATWAMQPAAFVNLVTRMFVLEPTLN